MKTSYVVPVCFAVAAHGALLFGFNAKARTIRPTEEVKYTTCIYYAPVVEDEPIVLDEPGDPAPKAMPEAPSLPRSAEPVTINLTDGFEIRPTLQVVSSSDVKVFVDDSGGVTDGTGDVMRKMSVITPGLLDKAPRTRFQAAPFYPPEARRSSLSGEVLVEFVVDEEGRVHDARVVRSTDRVFEEATLRAVARWVFVPGRRDGNVVRFRMAVPVMFNLND